MAGQAADGVTFAAGAWQARELRRDQLPQLQALFDANPAYFQRINGRDAYPNEAELEFDERPPPQLSYSRIWMLGLWHRAPAGEVLHGVAIVAADLCAAGAWHITLFFVDASHHGRGEAQRLYDALEAWMEAQGARWLRLVAVSANEQAVRFWMRQGFDVLRDGLRIDTGGRVNDVRVYLKPLGAATRAEYLEAVPRDRTPPA
jgi:GNAT superfamily N-acetyltransferase